MNKLIYYGAVCSCLAATLITGYAQNGRNDNGTDPPIDSVTQEKQSIGSTAAASNTNDDRLREAKQLLNESAALFIENRGQIRDTEGNTRNDIAFSASLGTAMIFFHGASVSYVLRNISTSPSKVADSVANAGTRNEISAYRLDMTFVGADAESDIIGDGTAEEEFNYYAGAVDPATENVPGYNRLLYKEIYEHIDLLCSSERGMLAYTFIVHPGGDPSKIALRFNGTTELYLDEVGQAHAATPLGDIVIGPAPDAAIVSVVDHVRKSHGPTTVQAARLVAENGILRVSSGTLVPSSTTLIALTAQAGRTAAITAQRTNLYRNAQ